MNNFIDTMNFKTALRDNIVIRRNLNNWSQKDLAEFIGMNPSTYANKEASGNFKTEELLAVANALKTSVDELLNSPAARMHSPEKEIDYDDAEIVLTSKERALIQLMRSSKKDKAFLIKIINYLRRNPNIPDDKANDIIEMLNK